MEYNMIFVMGYDLLQKKLNSWAIPCDVAFNICKEIYDDFLISKEYQLDMSEYNALCIYILHHEYSIDRLIETYGKFYN